MKAAITEKRVSIANEGQTKALPHTLVSKLLATLLTDQNEDILFQARSQGFRYDTEGGMETSGTLKARVKNANIIEKESEIEITLTGIVENQHGNEETCTLYFFMWWDQARVSPLKNNYRKTLESASLLIKTGNTSQRLADSVFELDLYREDLSRQQAFLGQGRGYLVFGRGLTKTKQLPQIGLT